MINKLADMEVDKVAKKAADMVADMMADKKNGRQKMADMELDKVVDMEVEKVADMVADIIGHRVGLFGPNFFNPKLTWLAHLLRITSSF